MPMPSTLVVKNGVKISLSLSAGIPGPAIGDGQLGKFFDTRRPNFEDAIFARRLFIASIPFTTRFR